MGLTSFSLSPSVNIYEYDLTIGVPVPSTSIAALAGPFRWGPVGQRVLVASEPILVQNHGQPTNFNAETFFTAAGFLAYGDQLYVSRAANTQGRSPVDVVTVSSGNNILIVANTLNPELRSGYEVISTNTAGVLQIGATIAQVVNGTAVAMTSPSYAIGSGTVEVQFVDNTAAYSAIGNTATVANLAQNIVRNEDDFVQQAGNFDPDLLFVARFPGELGNSIRVALCDSANAFSNTYSLSNNQLNGTNGGISVDMLTGTDFATATLTYNHSDGAPGNPAALAAVNAAAEAFIDFLGINDLLLMGNSRIGTQVLRITDIADYSSVVNTTVATATVQITFDEDLALIANQHITESLTRFWEFYTLAQVPPGQSNWQLTNGNTAALDELHIFVIDEGGQFSGVPGTILERYLNVSRATDAKTLDNEPNFYIDVLNQQSQFLWATNPRSVGYVNTAINLESTSNNDPLDMTLVLGSDGADEDTLPMASLAAAWELYQSAEDIDVNLILQGKARGGLNQAQLGQWLIDNLALKRLDVVVFISPDSTDLVNVSTDNDRINNLIDFRNDLSSTSYAVMDGNYKYIYDKYTNVYRWVPFNGDIAGLCAHTDRVRAPWWSPAGYNRGLLRGVVGLAWNPKKPYRDVLYPACINPIIDEKGVGPFLFGDKTLLEADSAFSRINVRRLFIYCEKAIASMARYFLFEFNDAYTRALFVNAVKPFLQSIKSARGITDFLVVCDESNNPPDVIDSWTMNADIYIKPARAINWINLNFIAVRTGTSFTEVIGTAY
jgi:tail sheath protein